MLLFGFPAILGDLISLSALMLVWWRVLLTSLSLFFLIRFGKTLRTLPRKLVLQYMGIGIIVAVHWICFFGSIKLANASIGVVTMATTSFFTALVEPVIFRRNIKWVELGLGLLVIPGMILIVKNVDWSMMAGIGVGLLSAFLAALFGVLNKQMIDKTDPLTITFLELGSGWLFLSLLLPFYYQNDPEMLFWPQGNDWYYLIFLALVCTTLAYVLVLRALKYISAFASNFAFNLEPVYGIILAWLILNENKELSSGFYLGSFIILAAVFSYPFIKMKLGKKRSPRK